MWIKFVGKSARIHMLVKLNLKNFYLIFEKGFQSIIFGSARFYIMFSAYALIVGAMFFFVDFFAYLDLFSSDRTEYQ